MAEMSRLHPVFTETAWVVVHAIRSVKKNIFIIELEAPIINNKIISYYEINRMLIHYVNPTFFLSGAVHQQQILLHKWCQHSYN